VVPFLKFTVLRLALFLVALVTVYWLSHSVVAAVFLGAVISALLSYVLLRGPRDELAGALQSKVQQRLSAGEERARDSAAARRRAEDDAVEDAAAEAEIARQEAARSKGAEPQSAEREPGAEQ
jgi:hypothetical protein